MSVRLCKDCKYYSYYNECHYHYQDRTSVVTGERSFRSDVATDMRDSNKWTYFWFWNNCNKSGRLWEAKDE